MLKAVRHALTARKGRRALALQKRESSAHMAVTDSVPAEVAGLDAGFTGDYCSNCGEALTGPFCAECGQKDDDMKRPFWALIAQLVEDLFSADSKLFKSMALLVFAPGGLSRAFVVGRRARYMSPVRLYILSTLVFFLLIWAAGIALVDIQLTVKENFGKEKQAAALEKMNTAPGTLREEDINAFVAAQMEQSNVPDWVIKEQRKKSQKISLSVMRSLQEIAGEAIEQVAGQATVEDSTSRDEGRAQDTQEKGNARPLGSNALDASPETPIQAGGSENSETTEKAGRADVGNRAFSLNTGRDFPYNIEVYLFNPITDDVRTGLREEDIAEITDNEENPEFVKKMVTGFSRGLQDPARFNGLFNDWLPRALFFLVPVFALILKTFHWGKERLFIHQLVFSLHFHSFLFLQLAVFALLIPYAQNLFVRVPAEEAFWFIISVYLIVALKVGQNQGWVSSFLKAGPIFVIYGIIMTLTVAGAIMGGLTEI